ncbi:hypothetical protein GcC1_c11240o21 [Golovinomyces cichoracearum]|uniref:Uncharacterized protein n=1 Tax=Golovinomyces cichoracearum TaxID=62708 RepID=A0A420J7S1_9PEZI|nr:hypothetical protein GcC1_c11240o21 [Golovinomyces cichoracearum]
MSLPELHLLLFTLLLVSSVLQSFQKLLAWVQLQSLRIDLFNFS